METALTLSQANLGRTPLTTTHLPPPSRPCLSPALPLSRASVSSSVKRGQLHILAEKVLRGFRKRAVLSDLYFL